VLSLVIAPIDESLPTRPDASWADVNVWSTPEGQMCAFSSSEGRHHWLHWPGVASFRFTRGSGAVTAIPYPEARPEIIRTTFHHTVLPLALQALGREGLHASAVVASCGVVAFCGKTQTGKSTLAYALSRRGLEPWSDDAVVWETGPNGPMAVRLPFDVHLRPQALSFFGHSSPSDVPPPQQGVGARVPLAAVCVLQRIPIDSAAPVVSIEPVAGGRSLTALLDHAHCFNPYDAARTRRMLQNYLALLDRVPVYTLAFRPSLDHMPQLLDAITDAVIAP